MRKLISLVVVLVVALSCGVASAASSKATVSIGGINVLEGYAYDGVILSNQIHVANDKDLVMDVSLECGLYTRTLVKSKGGNKDTSFAGATIKVEVWIDKGTANQRQAYPGEVVFNSREQELSATFQGLLEGCLTVDEFGNVIIDEACLLPEELDLILNTMSANAFNFVVLDLSAGTHTVSVHATIETVETAQEGLAEAMATIGKGSMAVEEVRFIKDGNFSF